MLALPWQVVTRWLSSDGSEFVQILAFPSLEEARQEATRLAPLVGTFVHGKVLKSVGLVGPTVDPASGSPNP